VLRPDSGKILLYYHYADLIYDNENPHHITGTSYAWLGLTSMRNDKTLTKKEAKKPVRADSQNNPSSN
jgi:hypothetical protein